MGAGDRDKDCRRIVEPERQPLVAELNQAGGAGAQHGNRSIRMEAKLMQAMDQMRIAVDFGNDARFAGPQHFERDKFGQRLHGGLAGFEIQSQSWLSYRGSSTRGTRSGQFSVDGSRTFATLRFDASLATWELRTGESAVP